MKFAGFRYHGRKAAMKKVSQRYTEFLQVYFIAGDLDAVGPEAVGPVSYTHLEDVGNHDKEPRNSYRKC